MELLITLAIFVGLPIYLGNKIAVDRGWSTSKALVATLFFGWIAVVLMFIFLPPKK